MSVIIEEKSAWVNDKIIYIADTLVTISISTENKDISWRSR